MMLSGILLPRLILSSYGSSVNGLVSSISQFLSIITFLDLGVGSVVQSALYRPLAKGESDRVSSVLKAANNYFRNISYALIIYIIFLIFLYPKFAGIEISDNFSTAILIIAISISSFAQYYFGLANELLLNADQKSYIQTSSEIVVVVLNLIASTILISMGYSIQIVKLVSGLIFFTRPLFLRYYVKKNYNINHNLKTEKNSLPQKWDGVGQHIAYSINNSTDVIILTVFSTLVNVSIFSVYNMIINAINLVISSFTTSLQSFFGNLLGNDEFSELEDQFSYIEWGLHTVSTLLYGLTVILIVPFVMEYTRGINDVNYNVPVFAFCLTISKFGYSLRMPYQSLIFAAGHFKQTRFGSYVEAGINISLSLIFVQWLGLMGVALGSLIAMFYRTVYLAVYLSENIIKRPISLFLKNLIVDIIVLLLIIFIGNIVINRMQINDFTDWFLAAIVLSALSSVVVFVINYLFYEKNIKITLSNFFKKI